MKLTYRQANRLKLALMFLGGTYNKIIKEGGRDVAVAVPYRYGKKSKTVRSDAAANLRQLEPHVERYVDAKNELILELTAPDEKNPSRIPGVIPDEDAELNAKYSLRIRALDLTEIPADLKLIEIPEADLDLDNNPLPPDVIAALKDIPPGSAAPAPAPEPEA